MYNRIKEIVEKNPVVKLSECKTEEMINYLIKNNVIVLPIEKGTKVYGVTSPCSFCPEYDLPFTEEIIEKCRKCKQAIIIECEFDYEMIDGWGKDVFSCKAEAEAELERRRRTINA